MKYKGALSSLPVDIVYKMLTRQMEQQGGKADPSVFESNLSACQEEGGFDWDRTREGADFWIEVIDYKNHTLFFNRYPEYSVKPVLEGGEIEGQIKDFPIEVVYKMLDNQYSQTGKYNISVFEKYISSDRKGGGFNWSESKEGSEFWTKVGHNRDFKYFYNKFPKTSDAIPDPVISEKDIKGRISGFPIEVVAKMLERQFQQYGEYDIYVFQHSEDASRSQGGFTWSDTPEGNIFWSDVINCRRFDKFYEMYPKRSKVVSNHILSEKDIKGSIIGFPIEVVTKMLERQKECTGKYNISVFQDLKHAGTSSGGFDWTATVEGDKFWRKVINEKDFEHFYSVYPKIESTIIPNQKTKEDEVQRNAVSITATEGRSGNSISGRRRSTSVVSRPISYKPISGRS